MYSYFSAQLNTFLEEIKPKNIKIKNLQIWKKNNSTQLTVIINNETKATNLIDCEQIHKLINIWSKKENIQNIKIIVKSEGLDKELFTLEDYQKSIKEKIKIELKNKINERKNYTGFLIDIKNDKLIVKAENLEYIINFDNIKKGKVIPNI